MVHRDADWYKAYAIDLGWYVKAFNKTETVDEIKLPTGKKGYILFSRWGTPFTNKKPAVLVPQPDRENGDTFVQAVFSVEMRDSEDEAWDDLPLDSDIIYAYSESSK